MERIYSCLIGVFFSLLSYGQFTAGIGYDFLFLNPRVEDFTYDLIVVNENETRDLYTVRNDFGALSHGIGLRSFGGQFLNPKKFVPGYSLEIGYRYFSSSSDVLYRESSTTDPDSIVNLMGGLKFRTNYHLINFYHFFDFHVNLSEKIKLTNSFGLGIEAIVKASSPSAGYRAEIVSTNHPILKLNYRPQLIEKYERLSIVYFASIDLFAFSLFKNSDPYENTDFRIPFDQLRFNGIGVRFLPHFKEKEPELEYNPNY